MRGADQHQKHMFSYLSSEERVRKDHPLRAIRVMVDEVLRQLSRRFDSMYASVGRPSIPPEKLLRAQLLQMLYSIRSERLLMEEMDYNLLFRWFVGLNADDDVWDPTVFTKNRDRLLGADVRADVAGNMGIANGAVKLMDDHWWVGHTGAEIAVEVKRVTDQIKAWLGPMVPELNEGLKLADSGIPDSSGGSTPYQETLRPEDRRSLVSQSEDGIRSHRTVSRNQGSQECDQQDSRREDRQNWPAKAVQSK